MLVTEYKNKLHRDTRHKTTHHRCRKSPKPSFFPTTVTQPISSGWVQKQRVRFTLWFSTCGQTAREKRITPSGWWGEKKREGYFPSDGAVQWGERGADRAGLLHGVMLHWEPEPVRRPPSPAAGAGLNVELQRRPRWGTAGLLKKKIYDGGSADATPVCDLAQLQPSTDSQDMCTCDTHSILYCI